MASVFKSAQAQAQAKRKSHGDASTSTEAPVRRNKQRVLVLPSRGVTSRMRHLVADIESLLPHSNMDSKLDSKSDLSILNELAELNNCNNTLYFEARKHEDLYLWASKTPNGPSVKFQVLNIHTMDELKMTGNCLKGSRHILSFDKAFDESPHLALVKEMFTQIFGVPRGARRSKPFVDHVLSFSVLDGKVWFRNFQIIDAAADPGATALTAAGVDDDGAGEDGKAGKKGAKGRGSAALAKKAEDKAPTLVEIGPRFVLTPIRMFEGSFGGATLYENPEYVPPNTLRHEERRRKGDKYKLRVDAEHKLESKKRKLADERADDPLERKKIFA